MMKQEITQGVILAAIFGTMIWCAGRVSNPRIAWIVTVVLLLLFCAILGRWIMKSSLGIFVTNQNLMSLSRLQLVAWTIVVLSAYFVMLMQRITHAVSNPLAITVDNNLWCLLSISTASFVATPIILNGKTQSTPDPKAVRTASVALKENAASIQQNAQGKLYANSQPSDARFSDIFQGDEIGNTAYIDVSKLQMFMLTLFLVASYCSYLWAIFATRYPGSGQPWFSSLPTFSQDELKLLALSHAGYLTFKAANHTPDSNSGN
jgi:hypothetical protein